MEQAETWGGRTVVVTCPYCRSKIYKALTQARTHVTCPCRRVIVTSHLFDVSLTNPAGLDLIQQLEAGLGEGG